ncbi:MAG: DUF5924 family protein [Betaproteobacteria bacterium]
MEGGLLSDAGQPALDRAAEDHRRRPPSAALHERARRFWTRHRITVWTLHSAWSIASGSAIVLLARERYHLAAWIVFGLAATWALTLFFARPAAADESPRLVHAVTSYATRVLYQETLFFLIPFYAGSTVFGSLNALFLALLAVLAALSCADLLFDRWMRTSPGFALSFFAVVSFAAINLLLPLFVGLRPGLAEPAAALLAVAAVVPLGLHAAGRVPGGRFRLAVTAAVLLMVTIAAPGVIPPVPLRLQRAVFASGIDRVTLTPRDRISDHVRSGAVGRELVVLAQVFAPSALPATVRLEWRRDGTLLRTSRTVRIVAHASGFRVWDGWSSATGSVPPGRYRVTLQTDDGRVFGVATLTVDA